MKYKAQRLITIDYIKDVSALFSPTLYLIYKLDWKGIVLSDVFGNPF